MRENKEIKTSGGHTVIVRSYLTFNEVEPILKLTEDKVAMNAKAVESAIVSIDGAIENAYAKVRELPFKEYIEVLNEVTKSIGGDFPQAK